MNCQKWTFLQVFDFAIPKYLAGGEIKLLQYSKPQTHPGMAKLHVLQTLIALKSCSCKIVARPLSSGLRPKVLTAFLIG